MPLNRSVPGPVMFSPAEPPKFAETVPDEPLYMPAYDREPSCTTPPEKEIDAPVWVNVLPPRSSVPPLATMELAAGRAAALFI